MLQFRRLTADDQDKLWRWLHLALWDPPPAGLRPVEVLQAPAVRIYAEDWGREQLGIALEPEYQHKGHGRPLMNAALDAAREGYQLMVVDLQSSTRTNRLRGRDGAGGSMDACRFEIEDRQERSPDDVKLRRKSPGS